MLAHRHPQHLDRAAVVVVLDQRAVEAEEEVVGEGAGLAAAGPVRLVQHGQALEPVQRLRGRGRRHQREGPQLAVFLHAAADLRTRVRADQLQEVAAGGAHRPAQLWRLKDRRRGALTLTDRLLGPAVLAP